MSVPGPSAQASSRRRQRRERVALVAYGGEEEPPREIGAVLVRDGFAPAVFDRVESLPEASAVVELAAIVLWLADADAMATELLERLAPRLGLAPAVLACPTIERRDVRAALAAGVAGVVVERDLAQGLGPCLRAVCAGQTCVPRGHWRELAPAALSLREKQVLGLVAMGFTNRQIGERLYLAESTVKSHLSSAFAKLGVRSRSEAADLLFGRERALRVGVLQLYGEPPTESVPTVLAAGLAIPGLV